jgi:hypothetical protein
MANKRISSLDDITLVGGTSTPGLANSDIIPITDISDTTGSAQGTTKKVTVANLLSGLQAEPAEGAFVDGDKTKLDGIEAGADVTDATNVEAAGALMDSEVTNLAEVKAFSSADYATASHTHAIDDLSDVDLTTTAPTNVDFLKYDGSNWVPAVPTADVDTPLTTALRGTDNPHIGAYPNQSFKVIDNPYKSVMVVADEAGNLKLLNSLGVNNIAVGFSVVEDGVEPDIEVVSGSETYSVISGDSDTKGANGLPLRQGFNLPDIGANPAPILISGGSIA